MLDPHARPGANVRSSPSPARAGSAVSSTIVRGPRWWQELAGLVVKRRAEVGVAACIVVGYACIVAGVALVLPPAPVVLIGAGLGLLGIAGYRLVLAVVRDGVYVLSERSKTPTTPPPPAARSERNA